MVVRKAQEAVTLNSNTRGKIFIPGHLFLISLIPAGSQPVGVVLPTGRPQAISGLFTAHQNEKRVIMIF